MRLAFDLVNSVRSNLGYVQLIEGLNRIEGEEGGIGPFSILPAGAGTSQLISSCPGRLRSEEPMVTVAMGLG